MNANGVLEHTLGDILAVVKPVNDDWVARFQIIDEFREVVGSLESLRGDLYGISWLCSLFFV